MTEIRIRDFDYPDGVSLGEIPFTQVDDVLPTLKKWGINMPGDGFIDIERLSASFDYDPDKGTAVFEVMINEVGS